MRISANDWVGIEGVTPADAVELGELDRLQRLRGLGRLRAQVDPAPAALEGQELIATAAAALEVAHDVDELVVRRRVRVGIVLDGHRRAHPGQHRQEAGPGRVEAHPGHGQLARLVAELVEGAAEVCRQAGTVHPDRELQCAAAEATVAAESPAVTPLPDQWMPSRALLADLRAAFPRARIRLAAIAIAKPGRPNRRRVARVGAESSRPTSPARLNTRLGTISPRSTRRLAPSTAWTRPTSSSSGTRRGTRT